MYAQNSHERERHGGLASQNPALISPDPWWLNRQAWHDRFVSRNQSSFGLSGLSTMLDQDKSLTYTTHHVTRLGQRQAQA